MEILQKIINDKCLSFYKKNKLVFKAIEPFHLYFIQLQIAKLISNTNIDKEEELIKQSQHFKFNITLEDLKEDYIKEILKSKIINKETKDMVSKIIKNAEVIKLKDMFLSINFRMKAYSFWDQYFEKHFDYNNYKTLQARHFLNSITAPLLYSAYKENKELFFHETFNFLDKDKINTLINDKNIPIIFKEDIFNEYKDANSLETEIFISNVNSLFKIDL